MKKVINIKIDQEVKIKGSAPNMPKELEDILGKTEGDIKRRKNLSRSIFNGKDLKKHLFFLC